MSKFLRSATLIISLAIAGLAGCLSGYFLVSKIAPAIALNNARRHDVAMNAPAVLGEKITTASDPALSGRPNTAIIPIKIFLAGDIMLSRMVERRSLSQTSTAPFAYPFANFQNQISAADLAFANLETPLVDGAPIGPTDMIFRASPDWAPALKSAGFDILNLANNHILNQYQTGLLKTQTLLTEQGIATCGIGNASISGAVVIPVKDLRFGIACYTYDGIKANTAALAPQGLSTANLTRDLDYLKSQNVDFIIVSMHAGTEYATTANTQQTQFARQAVDLGADLVVGHHPHVVQNMELYKDKYIFYSLGNFIFDQMWSAPTRRGLALTLTIQPHEVTAIEYLPVVIENYSQPRPADPAEADWILKRLKWASALAR